MKVFKGFCFSVALSAIAMPASAQEQLDADFLPNLLQGCEDVSSSGTESRFVSCFEVPEGQFYARAYAYFSIENTDLDSLIRGSEERRTFRRMLESVLVNRKDKAYFVMRVTALDASGRNVVIGNYPLLSIERNGANEYRLSREIRMGSLPTRFLADDNSQIDFRIGVLVERESESHIAAHLGTIARLAGVSLPLPGEINLTHDQQILRAADQEISRLLSFRSEFGTLVPLEFGRNDQQAFETRATLSRFLPAGAHARLVIASYPQVSIFPSAPNPSGWYNLEPAAPGGELSGEILGTRLQGQTVSNLLLAELGPDLYNAIRYGDSEQQFINGCQRLENWLDNGGLSLTASDNDRVQWALMASNPMYSRQAVRAHPCVSTKDVTWARLGLGSLPIEEARLAEAHWLVFDGARREVDRARAIIAQAVEMRDRSRAIAEAARRSSGNEFYAGNVDEGLYSYAGQVLQRGVAVSGVLTETSPQRAGNTYEGELMQTEAGILFQGFGQYTSIRSADGIGFKEYVGNFEGNFGTGRGRITFHDGSTYSGATSRERPHGFGTLTSADGTTLYARFVDGLPEGLAVRVSPEGNRVGGEILASGAFRPGDE